MGRDRTNGDLQVPRAGHGPQAALEGTRRRDKAEGDKDSDCAQLTRRLHLKRQPHQPGEDVRRHCASTNDVRLLTLDKRQIKRDSILRRFLTSNDQIYYCTRSRASCLHKYTGTPV